MKQQKQKLEDWKKFNIVIIIAIMLLTIILICTISLVGAVYPGETQVLNMSEDFKNISYYEITGNLSYINITINGTMVYVKIPVDYDTSSFNLRFFGYNERVNTTTTTTSDDNHHSNNWGSSCLTNYTCTAWSSCVNDTQKRTCTKINPYCYAKPLNTTQKCVIVLTPKKDEAVKLSTQLPAEPSSTNDDGLIPGIWKIILLLILLVILVCSVIWYLFIRKKDDTEIITGSIKDIPIEEDKDLDDDEIEKVEEKPKEIKQKVKIGKKEMEDLTPPSEKERVLNPDYLTKFRRSELK